MRSLFIGALFLCAPLMAQGGGVSERPTEIVQPDYAITLPAGWEVSTGGGGGILFLFAPGSQEDDLFRENVSVLFEDQPNIQSLGEYYNMNLQGLRMLATDFSLEESGETEINGDAAKYLIFTHRTGVYDLKVLQYFLLAEGKAYIVTATATVEEFNRWVPAFKEIAHSLRII